MEYSENPRKNDDEHKDEKIKYNYPQMPMGYSSSMCNYEMKNCPMYGNPMYCPMFAKQHYYGTPYMSDRQKDDYDDSFEYDEYDQNDDYDESDMRQRRPKRRRRRYPYPYPPRPFPGQFPMPFPGSYPGPYPMPYYPYNYLNPFLLALPFLL